MLQSIALFYLNLTLSVVLLGVFAVYSYTRHIPKKIKLLIEHIKQGYE